MPLSNDISFPLDILKAIKVKAVPWCRQFVTSFSPQRPRFSPRPVHMEYVLDKVAPVFLATIILQVFHTHLLIYH
jgi:hypothetical protein